MLREFLEEYKKIHGNYTAFCYINRESREKIRVSKDRFLSDVDKMIVFWRNWAKEAGFCKRTNIGILAENSYEYLVEYFAIILSGNTVVPLNQSFEMERVAAYAKKIDLKALVYESYLGEPCISLDKFDLKEHYNNVTADKAINGNEGGYEKTPQNDIVLMLLSSGTSGESKVVELTDNNISAFAMDVIKKYSGTAVGNVICALPLYHIGGIIPALEEMARGRTYYISSAKGIMMDIMTDDFDRLVLVPAMAKKLLDKANSSKKVQKLLSSVKDILCLGAAMNKGLIEDIKSRGISPLTYYGMTETTGTVSYEGKYKDGACGRIADYCNVKIENGEILVAGENVASGYLGNDEETEAAFKDGWLHTGDLGYLDEDNYLYVTGRIKNTIILSNGENVSPDAIEAKLYDMTKISECIVYAKDDSIAVHINAEKGMEDEIRTFIEDLNATLTMPERIKHIYIEDKELPKNAMGKLDRKAFSMGS